MIKKLIVLGCLVAALLLFAVSSGLASQPFSLDPFGRLGSASPSINGVLRTTRSPFGFVITSTPARTHSLSVSAWIFQLSKAVPITPAIGFATDETCAYGGQEFISDYDGLGKIAGCTSDNSSDGTRTAVILSSCIISTGVWYNVVWTHQESGYNRLYINNVLVGQVATGPNTAGYAGTFKIGTYAKVDPGTWHFDGYTDDVAIWDRAITSTEVSAIYQDNRTTSPLTIAPGAGVECYRFNVLGTASIIGEKGGVGTIHGAAQVVPTP